MKPLMIATALYLISLPALANFSEMAQFAGPNPSLSASQAPDLARSKCTEYYQRQGAYSFQRFEASDGTCFLSADPFDIANFVYRAFLATNDGQLMVFNSFDEFETSNSHGARVFYFFPRGQTPDVSVSRNATQSHMKLGTPGMELILSQSQKKVLGMKGAQVKETAKISPSNRGGLEIIKSERLYLDAGFKMGQDPTQNPDSKSTFVDRTNKRCQVKNSEIFSYESNGDVDFKFSDSQLKSFMKERCPALQLNW